MKVSKRGEYAMRASCYLAERHGEGWMHIRMIVREEEIPAKFPLAPMASAVELRDLMERNPRQVGFYSVLMDVRNAVSSIIDDSSLADVVRRTGAIRSADDPDYAAP